MGLASLDPSYNLLRLPIVVRQMNPPAAGLDDPKLAGNWPARREREEAAQAGLQARQRSRPAEVEHDNAGTPLGRKARDLAEVAIQCDQGSAFRNASLEDDSVRCAAKPLLPHVRHVMAALPQEFDAAAAAVLIDLDLHSAGSSGTGMIRSRAASAP